MKPWARYLLLGTAGVIVGVGGAAWTVHAGALASGVQLGPWQSGSDFGTARASARTRAVVALRGLLALPAREARYYTAAVDDAGQPLDGRCRYRVTGGQLPGRWWSLTLYDGAGYLVKNDANIFSIESAGLAAAERERWQVTVAPTQQPGHWLPSGNLGHVELTLRLYLPSDGGRGDPPRAALPSITREACA